MDSKLLVTVHLWSVNIFLLVYLIKTILLFTGPQRLDRFSRFSRIPEMIVSVLFLATGIWLFAILGAIKLMQVMKLAFVLLSIPMAVAGFKKHNKAMALMALVFIVFAYGISEASRNKPYLPSSVEVASHVNAEHAEAMRLYLAHCAMCHGMDGNKEYRGAALLSASPMDTTAAAAIITSGVKRGPRGTMPGFAKVLSESQVRAVAAYIQQLKNPSSSPRDVTGK